MVERIKIQKRAVDCLPVREQRYTVWDNSLTGFGVRVMPSGRKSYVYKYRVGGGRSGQTREPVIGTHGDITPDQARGIARVWSAEVALGQDPSGERKESRAAPLMNALFDRYLSEHARPRKKPSSVKEDEALIENYLRPVFGRRRVRDVTRSDIARWHASLSETPYRANRAIAVLSKAMNLSEIWGIRTDGSNPCRQVQKYKEERRERFLSPDEFARLGEAIDAAERHQITTKSGTPLSPYATAAIRLLILTGARKSEVLSLKWDCIDLEAGRADLPDSKTGRKPLFFPPQAVEILRALPRLPDNPYVIAGGKCGSPLVNIRDPWHVIRNAACLDGVRIHDLRHSFASFGAAAGMSLPILGSLLGHRETATTARYAHLADGPQREAAALIGTALAEAMRRNPSSDEPQP